MNEPNELDVSAEYLRAVAQKIMREPPATEVDQADARADRLEIAFRCLLACAVLKELSFESCTEVGIRFVPDYPNLKL